MFACAMLLKICSFVLWFIIDVEVQLDKKGKGGGRGKT